MKRGQDYQPLQVVLRDGESVERLIRRFLKKVKKEGILEDLREHNYYKKPSDKKREKNKKRERVLYKLKQEEEKKNNY